MAEADIAYVATAGAGPIRVYHTLIAAIAMRRDDGLRRARPKAIPKA